MSTKLLAALKKRFRTPAEAIAALGLDASLLDEDDPTRPVIIAHDSADVVWETITNRSPIMSTQEARLMTALRRRFRGGPVEVLRRLGMDQSELAPPDDEPTDAVGELLKQFGALSDADKAEFVEAI